MKNQKYTSTLPFVSGVLVNLFFLPFFDDPFGLPKLWLMLLVTATLYISFVINRKELHLNKLLVFATSIFFLTLLTGFLFSESSVSRILLGTWQRNNGFLCYFCFTIFFIYTASLKSDTIQLKLLTSLSILGGFQSIYGILQFIGVDFNWGREDSSAILTLGNSNFASSFLAVTGLSTLVLIIYNQGTARLRIVLVMSLLIHLFLLSKIQVLQGLVLFFMGATFLIFHILFFSKRTSFKNFKLYPRFILTSLFLLVITFGFVMQRELSRVGLGSFKERNYYWLNAINMFKDNIFFGVGIDSYGDWYRVYRTQQEIDYIGTVANYSDNAHSVPFQMISTGGILLFSGYLILTLFVLKCGFKSMKNSNAKFLNGSIFILWFMLQMQSMISVDQIGLAIWNWIIAGVIVNNSYIDNSDKVFSVKQSRISKSVLYLGGVFLLLANFYCSIFFVNQLKVRNSLFAISNSDSQFSFTKNTNDLVETALRSNSEYSLNKSIRALLNLGQNSQALTLARHATQKFPRSLEAWHILATIYEKTLQFDKAVIAREKTVELDPLNIELKLLLEQDLKLAKKSPQ
jgi:O-antigen ligase